MNNFPRTPAFAPFLQLRRLVLAATLLLTMGGGSLRAADAVRHFSIPAGPAESTLGQFVEQASVQLIYDLEVVAGVRTQAVSGELDPLQALEQMLAGTAVRAVRDNATGALTISRIDRSRGESPPRPPRRKDGDAALGAGDDSVVRLEAFQVAGEIGRYAEKSSSVGTKTPMELKDYAGTVQILNAAFLSDQRARTLEDVFPYIVGMARESTDSVGFTLRGFGNANPGVTLQNLQIDGLPGTASRYGAPTTANIERVEVLKGPSSLLYGQLDPGGLINIVTKSPQVTASNNLFASVYTYGGETAPFGKEVSESAYIDSTGPIDSGKHLLYRMIASFDNIKSFRNYNFQHNYFFYPSLTYRWDANTELTAKLNIVNQRQHYDTGLIAPFSIISLVAARNVTYQEPNDVQYDNGDSLDTDFRHTFSDGWVLKIDTRNVLHKDGRRVIETKGVNSTLPVENSTVVRRLRHMINSRQYDFLDANVYGNFGPEALRSTLIVGLNGGYENSDLHRLAFGPTVLPNVNLYDPLIGVTDYPADTPAGNTHAILKMNNYAAYASDQIKIGAHWHADVGVRYDRQDATYNDPVLLLLQTQSVHAVVPSGGLIYEPTDHLSLYASYASSFIPLPPTTVDANGHAGFAPEKSNQVETGLKADFLENKLTAVLALYDIHRANVVENVPLGFLANGVQYSIPIGTQESTGVELSLTYQPIPNWEIELNGSYDDARVTKTLDLTILNTRLPNAPRQDESLWTRYNVPSGPLKGYGFGLGAFNVSDRVGTSTTNLPGKSYEIAGYWRVDTALYYEWGHSSVALNVQNVFDRKYILSVPLFFQITPGDPRRMTFSYKTQF
jgi:iron complex outermembrane receptor protein